MEPETELELAVYPLARGESLDFDRTPTVAEQMRRERASVLKQPSESSLPAAGPAPDSVDDSFIPRRVKGAPHFRRSFLSAVPCQPWYSGKGGELNAHRIARSQRCES